MDVEAADLSLAAVAGAIADPARSRMLCALLDGRARTATELAALADIGASSASGHFARLREQGLVEMLVQGRHRYYRLTNAQVAQALEALLLLTQHSAVPFKPNTPSASRQARTCYDHCAGEVAVKLHDALLKAGWLNEQGKDYVISERGVESLNALGIDVDAVRQQRRRLAYACLDWSERAPHIGGALGAALLELMLARGWVSRHLDSRALKLTAKGVGGMAKVFGV
ncbi:MULTISPECIES: ArsR/SmtB family transcription factor [Pseudomonas syringae group genomosp. 2]|uniref:ArsR/SmtB family transcription factor n=2 Tax=Pseudomonas syringae group TaxID=136849 RepID=UPI0001CC3820|nr:MULTISPECIES: winged helix-turn-helix domain-containing protein [Pseudomonas syringae group genomosp. 2]EGH00977.1 ArsR family transcriptional regulator [Pseudomonas amygdali pv. aesculi str. 0893_23]KWT04875.1 ArsR family transcriptional regulator [Pseudomonas amygdali pv. aesculi]KWT16622.1 ArsR family transcriptional regulator [Pseudomonas amygdali pv. aesculi]KWT21336.1 ArsR family transcriptional regulator [Pseudomonas amygdali pv. aesculi]KWT29238.1 ArsR family transcriptional regulat